MNRLGCESKHRALVIVTVDGPGNEFTSDTYFTRDTFYSLLKTAFDAANIPWASCEVEIAGQTATVLVEPQVSKSRLIGQLPSQLSSTVSQWSQEHLQQKSIKTRLALHAGEVYDSETGLPNPAIDFALKLSNAKDLKENLEQSSTSLGIIVSDWFYQNVINPDQAVTSEGYHRTASENSDADAWIRILEQPQNNEDFSASSAWYSLVKRLEQYNPGAKQLLELCACLAVAPIPQNILLGLWDQNMAEQLVEILQNPLKFDAAMSDIGSLGLASIDARNNTIQLHPQVHTLVFQQMSSPHQKQMRKIAHLALTKCDPQLPGIPKYWSYYREISPHVAETKAVESNNPAVRKVVINQMAFENASGAPKNCLAIANEAMALWGNRLGQSHPDTLAAARRVGLALRELGRYAEAAEVHQKTLELLTNSLNADDVETIHIAGLLSDDLRALGRFDAAKELDVDTYQRAKRVGEYSMYALYAAHNLALTTRLTGDHRTAAELNYQVWQGRQKILGPVDRFTLLSVNRLVSDMIELGDYTAARSRQEEAVIMLRTLLGDTHPEALSGIRNLAIARRKTGDFQGAFSLAQEAAQGFRKYFYENHPHTIAAAMTLSIDHRYSGNLTTAYDLATNSLQQYRVNLGAKHPFSLIGATNVAVTLRMLGKPEEAQQLNNESVRGLHFILGRNHPFTLGCGINLASDMAALGNIEASLTLNDDLIARLTQTQHREHPMLITARLNRLMDLKSLGRWGEAAEEHTEILEWLRHTLGPHNPSTVFAERLTRLNYDFDPMALW